MDHRNNFDLIRLYAACQVVLVHGFDHLQLPTGGLIWALAPFPGVPIFFIVSGFLVSGSFLQSRSVGSFFLKRSLRIYPALAVNILLLEAAMYAAGNSVIYDLSQFISYLAIYIATASSWIAYKLTGIYYVYSYDAGFFTRYPSGVLWTLTVEISFYIALAAVLIAYRANRIVGLAVLLATILASMWWSVDLRETVKESRLMQIVFLPYFWVFAIGVCARLAWDRIARFFQGTFLFWFALYVAVTAISVHFGSVLYVDFKDGDPLVFARMTLLGGVVLSGAYSFRGAATAVLRGNDLSYGIYLYHMLVISILVGFGLEKAPYLWIYVFAGAAGMAALSWFLVENPFLQMKRRAGKSNRPIVV